MPNIADGLSVDTLSAIAGICAELVQATRFVAAVRFPFAMLTLTDPTVPLRLEPGTSKTVRLLQGLTGARYDAVDKVLYLDPAIKGEFRAFLSTAAGFGTVGVRDGKPFLEVKRGRIDVARIEL